MATSGAVKNLRREMTAPKEMAADFTLEKRSLKNVNGDGENEA